MEAIDAERREDLAFLDVGLESYARFKGITVEQARLRIQNTQATRRLKGKKLSPQMEQLVRRVLEWYKKCDELDALPDGEKRDEEMGMLVATVQRFSTEVPPDDQRLVLRVAGSRSGVEAII